MKQDQWRLRLRAIGLTQSQIAALLGWHPPNLSRALSRDPPAREVTTIIRAAEIMTGEQRAQWLDETRPEPQISAH